MAVDYSKYDHLLDTIRTKTEFVVPSEKRKKLKKGGRAWRKREREMKLARDKKIERAHNRKLAQQRYYEKNKERLNAIRSARNACPTYVYNKARNKGPELWEDFPFEEWIKVWEECPRVVHPTNGFLVTAWSQRNSNYRKGAQMIRKDTSKPFTRDNVTIHYKGELYYDPCEENT